MGERVATLIIEPRSLIREALVSLMASHSYRVVCGVASTADIDITLPVADVPKLVILGALAAEDGTTAASSVRKQWPKTKIVHLFERASSADLQKWLASEIDGCVPLFASPDVLISTLQQILGTGLKILVQDAASRSAFALPSAPSSIAAVLGKEVGKEATGGASSIRTFHSLSEREGQILRCLIKGDSNKIIARKRNVAEATVKVHLKSILKKIRMANRTQAAIWALENGYGADDLHPEAAAA